jgi:hypothetical protein
MMPGPIMKCGHAAQGKDGNGKWSCVICWPNPDASIVDDNPPVFVGRRARCSHYGQKVGRKNECVTCRNGDGRCQCEVNSNPTRLAFFESCPNEEYDRFYCGCFGWD